MKKEAIVITLVIILVLAGLVIVSGIFLAEFAFGNLGISGKVVFDEDLENNNSTNLFDEFPD